MKKKKKKNKKKKKKKKEKKEKRKKKLITNLFKNTDIKFAFSTNNNIERLLST